MTPQDFRQHRELLMLASLPAYEPERECRERIRARCHAALQARRLSMAPSPVSARSHTWRRSLEFVATTVVCAGFLAEVLRRAMTVYGF